MGRIAGKLEKAFFIMEKGIGRKMKVNIIPTFAGNGFMLRSVEHPDCAAMVSFPEEVDQELLLSRLNMAFDTLAQGIAAQATGGWWDKDIQDSYAPKN
jgi:hypothetical protein